MNGPVTVRPTQSKAVMTPYFDTLVAQRHRLWGERLPCMDIDSLWVECRQYEPSIIVETKHYRMRLPERNANLMKRIRAVADRMDIPFIVVRYWPVLWAFQVHPYNDRAMLLFDDPWDCTEQQYVAKMHEIRRIPVGELERAALSQGIFRELGNDFPPADTEIAEYEATYRPDEVYLEVMAHHFCAAVRKAMTDRQKVQNLGVYSRVARELEGHLHRGKA